MLIAFMAGALGAADPVLSKRITPTLPAKTAIDTAEKYISENAMNMSGKFLSSVKYHETGPLTEENPILKTRGPYWQLTYEPDIHADGGQIFVLIYMNRKARHVGGR